MERKERRGWSFAKLGAGLLLVLGMASCAAPGVRDYAENDAEGYDYGMTDRDVFSTNFASTGYYDTWDADKNGYLDENEFRAGYYDTWDSDNSGFIEEDEWGVGAFSGEAWDSWEADNDGLLGGEEFGVGFDSNGYYDTWDSDNDGLLNEDETYAGVFSEWDNDDDGYLNNTEYAPRNGFFQ